MSIDTSNALSSCPFIFDVFMMLPFILDNGTIAPKRWTNVSCLDINLVLLPLSREFNFANFIKFLPLRYYAIIIIKVLLELFKYENKTLWPLCKKRIELEVECSRSRNVELRGHSPPIMQRLKRRSQLAL